MVGACGESEAPKAPEDREAGRAFLGAVIPSHESTLRIAEEAQVRAEHPELRSIAAEIAVVRRRELADLQRLGLSRDDLGLGPPPPPGAGGLSPTAAPYDRLLADSLVPPAQNAIRAAQAAVAAAEDPRLTELARRVAAGQVCEIYELNRLRARFYGLPSPAGEAPLGRRRLRVRYRRCRVAAESRSVE